MNRLKYTSLLMCLFAVLPLCAQHYHIEGNTEGISSGTKIYIKDTKKNVLDSATVENGSFLFNKPLQTVQPAILSIGLSKQLFLLDENPIQVLCRMTEKEMKGKKTQALTWNVKGGTDQTLYATMNRALTQEMYAMLAISFMAKDSISEQQRDTLGIIYVHAKDHTRTVFDSIVNHCPDSYVSALILNDHFIKERPLPEMERLYDSLSTRIKESSLGKELLEKLNAVRKTGIGQTAPDFTLISPDGKHISLSSLRGNYVLLDFWASWCGPCLREVPNIKKVYERYHDKGFEILSVSLDDKKENWEQAITRNQLNWLHVSSLKGWKCPVAELYNVTAVPSMFLIDKEGRILSNKARGEILENELEKLYKTTQP